MGIKDEYIPEPYQRYIPEKIDDIWCIFDNSTRSPILQVFNCSSDIKTRFRTERLAEMMSEKDFE